MEHEYKMKPFKLSFVGIEWGRPYTEYRNPNAYFYYFYWWNWLPKEYRSWGFEQIYYDGPHNMFNFWFFNISWSTPWTKTIQDNKLS
jgi:hypothetical protein